MNQRSGTLARATRMRVFLGLALACSVLLAGPAAHAKKKKSAPKKEVVTLEDTKPEEAPKEEPAPAPPPEPEKPPAPAEEPVPVKRVIPPYSLPWQLRPVLPVSMIRSDTSLAFYGVNGFTAVSFISGSYKIIPQVGVFAKLGVASDSPPTNTGGFTFGNPIIGGAFGFWPAKSMKLGASLGLGLPIGSGGSQSNDPGAREANRAAMFARSGFDNAVFMPDYFSVLPGVDFAIVTHNLTLQAELNLVFLAKVRGIQTEKSAHQDLSMGLHAGYFFFPWLSAGLDFRYQYWLSKAFVVPNDPASTVITPDPTGESRDNLTVALGPRFHIQVSDELWLRPGVSMTLGIDNPIGGSHYKTIQLDVPFFF